MLLHPIVVLNKYKHEITGAVPIGRPSPLGNPFRLTSAGGPYERGEAIALYRQWLRAKLAVRDPDVCTVMDALYELAQRDVLYLWCTCVPHPCHGDVIVELLEERWMLEEAHLGCLI